MLRGEILNKGNDQRPEDARDDRKPEEARDSYESALALTCKCPCPCVVTHAVCPAHAPSPTRPHPRAHHQSYQDRTYFRWWMLYMTKGKF